MNYDLSILIPAKNEEFLGKTIENILENVEGNTQVIAVLDGYETEIPKIPEDERVLIIKNEVSEGQRKATNNACRMSNAKYVMKLDAHCAMDKGFDVKMLKAFEKTGDNCVIIPIMRNLHAFDWVCKNGHRRYQGPSGECKECGLPTEKDILWIGKDNPQSTSYCFDEEPHFQYFNEYKKREEYKEMFQTGLTETMSIQGSCFMLTREKYWELNISDENLPSWGSQGIEVACKMWLSGGSVFVNHSTWYAHMFRTQGGDFSFPYENPGRNVEKAKKLMRELFFDNKWEKQVRPLSWLIEKFWPIKGWTEEMREKIKIWPLSNGKPNRGIIYYTDNKLKWSIATSCRNQIKKIGLPIVSCTLKKSDMGKNIVLKEERSYKTMFKQILTALKESTADIIYFTEHDVLYHPSHFDFIPENKETFYYNGNYWMLRQDGFAIHYDVSPLSGLVAYREPLIKHFEERIKMIEEKGFGYYMGFEPFTHNRIKWDFWCNFEVFQSEYPNIDIAHDNNLTPKRWSQERFIKKPKFWEESDIDHIPGWKNLRNLIKY
jgi:glycosyltransferase involved in cell wall biosynthesis